MTTSDDRAPGTTGWRPTPKMIAALVLLVLLVVFALLNRASTEIDLFGATFQSPLWVWLLVMLVLGLVIGAALPWGRRRR